MTTAAADTDYLTSLLDRGVNLAFDLFGFDHSLLGEGRYAPSDWDVAHAVSDLVRAGHVDRLLLSQDVGVRPASSIRRLGLRPPVRTRRAAASPGGMHRPRRRDDAGRQSAPNADVGVNIEGVGMRTAVVTGSARGIGAAVAERLAQSGYQVVGVDRSPHEAGYLARTVVADLGSAAQCAEVFEQVGHVDALVNNAALLVDRPLEETTVDDMDSLLSVNLRAAMIMTKLALPGMVERGWGRVVNMSSVGARTGGYASSGVYNTTKAGLISFTKYVARHYGPRRRDRECGGTGRHPDRDDGPSGR